MQSEKLVHRQNIPDNRGGLSGVRAIGITKYGKQDMVIVGTPEECLAKFLKYEDGALTAKFCAMSLRAPDP